MSTTTDRRRHRSGDPPDSPAAPRYAQRPGACARCGNPILVEHTDFLSDTQCHARLRFWRCPLCSHHHWSTYGTLDTHGVTGPVDPDGS